MASLGRLTAGIAHEINNPLGIALGNLSPLTDYVEAMMNLIGMHDDFIAQLEETGEAAVPDQIANYKQEKDVSFILEDLSSVISDSRSSLLRVKSIVSDLSSLSQGMESERESCCLKAICDEVVKLNFYENDLQPRIDNLIGSDIELESNSALLKQVFSNLHVNALEALEINCDDPSITYRCEIKHEQLYVTIEDNGCGIPSDKINQVVDPFFTTKPLGDGKGLGLTVACNVVNGLGGDLSLESLQGKGTKVMVSLPLKAEQGERVGPNSVKA
nr:ATP-binding protein [Vibrio ostreicida]